MRGITVTMIFVIPVLFLFGCGGDSQVTEDMLVGGEWKCETVDSQQAYFNDGKFGDAVIDANKIGTMRVISYFKKDNDFFVSVDRNPQKHKYEFRVKSEYYLKTNDNVTEKIEYVYVSNDEYKYIVNGDISRFLPDGNVESLSKYKKIDNCLRNN
ncbi:hypothetical protein I2494_13475 [Budviciaceae bacterium BWR-B9]|uniref:Lipoprotein n=1 Tax=Limnobaculum allomyrinae TaxID=2791986 RepID=A0ABS1IST0_9GAMM|nr:MULTISPECIES: hypothetical protein [Limnobaculum]MBK5144709.1 hypothetical protein [Limnobaculum allomyrinae]MBV7692372.1 hypothetical protein [Limnobaculum sp. M2-1]